MRIFSRLYDLALRWSRHPHAPRYLAALSFAESSFFPVPPDVMLAPMALAMPRRAWRLAALTTLASVAGGVLGYVIGAFAFDLVAPWLQAAGYWPHYQRAAAWFGEWGVWVVFLAGFTPIPYKIFTISAGVVGMAFAPFVAASLVGRGARFYLVAGLIRWGGEPMERALRRHVDTIGYLAVVLAVIVYFAVN